MTHLIKKCPNLTQFGKFKITANRNNNPIKTNFWNSLLKTTNFRSFDIDLTSYESPFFDIIKYNKIRNIKLDLPMLENL